MGWWSNQGTFCPQEGLKRLPANRFLMRLAGIDLTAELQLHSLHSGHSAAACSTCERRLLPGELLHVYESGRTLCTLCRARLPEDERSPIRSERIHSTPVRLAVAPRAA